MAQYLMDQMAAGSRGRYRAWSRRVRKVRGTIVRNFLEVEFIITRRNAQSSPRARRPRSRSK